MTANQSHCEMGRCCTAALSAGHELQARSRYDAVRDTGANSWWDRICCMVQGTGTTCAVRQRGSQSYVLGTSVMDPLHIVGQERAQPL